MFQSRTHTCGELRLSDAGKTVTLAGWMENVREVGSNFAFVVLRDFYGTTQVVIESEEMMAVVKPLNKESTISVTGVVRERESKNKKIPTGEIEVVPTEIKVLGRCRYNELPFEINRSREADETQRLKYRYLDLRNPAVKQNIILRCNVVAALLIVNGIVFCQISLVCRHLLVQIIVGGNPGIVIRRILLQIIICKIQKYILLHAGRQSAGIHTGAAEHIRPVSRCKHQRGLIDKVHARAEAIIDLNIGRINCSLAHQRDPGVVISEVSAVIAAPPHAKRLTFLHQRQRNLHKKLVRCTGCIVRNTFC